MLPKPHVAIAILNYNGKKHLERFLPSVVSCNYPNLSIWLIDNQSNDDSLSFLKSAYPEIRIVQNGHNYGFAAGYNKGLEKIVADYFLILNSDVEIEPGFLEPMIEMMESNPSIAFVQPRILSFESKDRFEYAGAGGGQIDALGYPFCRGRIFESIELDAGQYNDEQIIFWATGAAMLARATAFRSLGGFYEFYFMHNEEIDLCWRAQCAGWKVAYCGRSVVYHLGAGSLSKESPRKTFFNFRNNLVMITRNLPIGRLLWVLPLRLFLDFVASMHFATKKHTPNAIAVLKAWMAFLWWWVSPGKAKWPGCRKFRPLQGHCEGSIVWQYFVLKRNKFSQIR